MKKDLCAVLLVVTAMLTAMSCKKDSGVPPPPPPSDGETITLNGGTGGTAAGNSVFADLSAGRQDSVKRTAWDLGFYCGSDFRVIINNTTAATAKATDKNDLTQITTADTTGFATALFLGFGEGTMDIIDDPEGDLTKTVIAPVSATDADNKVYIVKLSNGLVAPEKDWYKIRVLRNGSGYQLQYARLSESNVKTLDIAKQTDFNFQYVSLDNNALVSIEPKKTDWDIEWTLTTYKASPVIPYTFSDFVYINSLAGVTAAEVLTSTVSYAAYDESHISATALSNSKVIIGAGWRTASPSGTGVKTDRFYVIKDVAGNVYKLKFVSFSSEDGGERGKPVIEYKLVKKA